MACFGQILESHSRPIGRCLPKPSIAKFGGANVFLVVRSSETAFLPPRKTATNETRGTTASGRSDLVTCQIHAMEKWRGRKRLGRAKKTPAQNLFAGNVYSCDRRVSETYENRCWFSIVRNSPVAACRLSQQSTVPSTDDRIPAPVDIVTCIASSHASSLSLSRLSGFVVFGSGKDWSSFEAFLPILVVVVVIQRPIRVVFLARGFFVTVRSETTTPGDETGH